MRSFRRLLLVAVSGVAVIAGAGLPAIALAQTPAATAPAAGTTPPNVPWTQTISDIAPDPAVRFGTLPNGMKYAIMRNATPPSQAALYLQFNAGSLNETDEQQGLAHFLEHMAFNGSTNIPEGEMTRRLERLGLSFGGDTNAFTGFDQTAYTLNLPNTTDEVVETSLFVLRETADELLFDATAVDAERGVIVGEERTRDTPALRNSKALYAFLAPGQRVATRWPIGDLDIIRSAPRDRFVDFYKAYYRPERATLIAVGDFDVDKMEAQVTSAFESWTNANPDGPNPDLGQVQPREAETHIHLEPGTQSIARIFWTRPAVIRPDSTVERTEDLTRAIGLAVFNRRMAELARAENPPFLGGGAASETIVDSVESGTLGVAYNPGGWKRAIETAEQEQRRLVEFGVSQTEIDREITPVRAALETAVAAAATRQTPALAGALLGALSGNNVFSTPATDLAQFEQVVAGLTVETVNAAVRANFSGNGPLVFLTTPVEIEGGEAAVTAAIEASRLVPVTAPVVAAAVEWPYTDFGTPAQPSGQTEIADLGTTLVTFPNGVKLTVKPTAFTDEQILVSVTAGQGQLGLPTDVSVPTWAAGAIGDGGLGKLTRTQLEQVLAGNIVGAGFGIGANSYQFGGGTRPADLALQMQLLAAYFTDAAWRPEPFAQIKGSYAQSLAQSSATARGAFSRYGSPMLSTGDRRFSVPTDEEIASAELADIRDRVKASIAEGPITITIVGDITVADAITAVGSTFGALPMRSAAVEPTAAALTRTFPAPTPTPVEIKHTGLASQAMGFVAWPTVDSIENRKESRVVSLLANVLQLRVTDELREKQGVAYSPAADSISSTTFPDYGYAFVRAETPPEALAGFFTSVDAVATSLRDEEITDDELNRARLSTVEAIRRAQNTNGYWLGSLSEVQSKPAEVEAIRTAISDLEAIKPADIQRAAAAYLKPDTAWRAQVTSSNPTPDPVAPATQ